MKFTFAPESKPLDGYTIKRAIHRGGFGEVYYALSDGGKEVALKLLNNNLEVELRGVAQCLNLKHPNLVTIFDMKTDGDGDHWIVMEYVAGEGLDKVAARYPDGMPMEQILKWLSGMSAGLAFLHDRGIVHRDLKPANIFSDATGVKIGDVGLSKFISESRRSAQTQSVGTVYYMAPEVARGRYGREVDIYALGIILYELITGRVPFEGETTAEILMKHLSERPDLTPIPERLRPVLARALEKDPQRRIGDAKQLEEEFRNAVRGVGRATPPPPPAGPTRPPTPPYPTSAPRQPDLGATVVRGRSGKPQNGLVAWFVSLSPFAKCALGGIAFVFLMRTGVLSGNLAEVLIPGLCLGLVAYAGYSLYQWIFGKPETPPPAPVAYAAAPARPAVAPPPAHPAKPGKPAQAFRRAKVVKPRPLSPATVRDVSFRQRMMELTGSMTLAAVCTVIMTFVLAATDMWRTEGQIALFGFVTLIASWAIMGVCKLTEGSSAGGLGRRVMLAGTGAAVGLIAHVLNGALLADVPVGDHGSPLFDNHELYEFGQPSLVLFTVFFAALFFVRRWWWHADSFRSGRFRVSTTLVTLAAAFLVCGFTGFDFMWGLTWAIAVSSIVQLASVWTPADHRPRVVNQAGMRA